MKRVISISLGASSRNHRVETSILGEKFIIERRGTDGDKKKAAKLFTDLDGKYDAFGMGGIDLYIQSAGRKYVFRDAKKLIKNVTRTPVVDGSGLKNTLERTVIEYLYYELDLNLSCKKVLMVAAVDRFGMAETFDKYGADMNCGDLIFSLGLPIPIRSIKTLEKLARIVAPVITKLPFELVYPTGKKQEKTSTKSSCTKYYYEADIIAGDFHYINQYMPEDLTGKIIITNTITEKNLKLFKNRGVKLLITTTPELEGRSFGTNVMEAVLVALADKSPEVLTGEDYLELLEKIEFTPRVVNFNYNAAS